jgi:hypothetical protein
MTTEFTDSLPALPAEPEPPPAAVVKSDVKSEPAPEPAAAPAAGPKSSRWKELLVTALLAGVVAAVVGSVVAGAWIVGMGVSLGWLPPAPQPEKDRAGELLKVKYDGKMLDQKGRVTVPAGETVEVFYPVPYLNPPALTWRTDNREYFTVISQGVAGFKVKSNLGQAWDMEWEATGVAAR